MNDIAAALQQPADLDFELPDPEDEEILESDFLQQLDVAWQVCDRFDLQTEIWRGRILRSIRDREKKGGDGRGTGFLKWLKEREISKTQAYSEAAEKGDRITRREVRQLSDEWTAMSSDLLPEEVREKAADNSLPPRYIAPLVKEMEKLPELHQKALQRDIAANPDVDTVKQATSEARQLAKYLKSAAQVQALIAEDVDIETALEEAQRVGCLSIAADLVNQASQIEQTIAKLYMTWKKIVNLADRLYVDTGASTPNLRSLLTCIEPLGGEIMELQLSGAIEHTIRLQIQEAS